MKKYAVTIAGLFLIVAILVGIKSLQIGTLIKAGETMVMPPTVIATTVVEAQRWEKTIPAVGSLEAVQGVTITADIPGRVTEILFSGGAEVQTGDILLRQDTSSEQAQLRVAQANAALAKANLARTTELYRKKVASKSQFDTAEAEFKAAIAQADTAQTSIDKKTIRAPFDGRLGIRLVNVGEDLSTGEAIVSLQAVDPIYVNFSLPQRDLPKLHLDLDVRLTADAVAGKTFHGTITAINPEIDPATRSLKVQATLKNADHALLPGMFANVDVVLPDTEDVLAVPSTAVAYATFGDSVFVVKEEKNEKTGESGLVARQQFIRRGRTRGDFVAIDAGVDVGDEVVSGGVFKLQNGAPVSVNNDIKPDYSLNPTPEDS